MKKLFLIFIGLINVVHAQTPTDSLNVTPNPFQKRTCAFYSFQNNDTISLTVYNTVAQVILTPKSNSVMSSGFYQDSLIMDAFPDGIYFVVLKINQKTINKKVIKTINAGISEKTISNVINIFPNPVSNTIWITNENKEFENSQIKITNTSGQTVLSLPFKKEIDVSNLPRGFYIVRIKTENGLEYNSKFIKE